VHYMRPVHQHAHARRAHRGLQWEHVNGQPSDSVIRTPTLRAKSPTPGALGLLFPTSPPASPPVSPA